MNGNTKVLSYKLINTQSVISSPMDGISCLVPQEQFSGSVIHDSPSVIKNNTSTHIVLNQNQSSVNSKTSPVLDSFIVCDKFSASTDRVEKNALGSCENPIELIQNGTTLQSTQNLSDEHLQQIAQALQQMTTEKEPEEKVEPLDDYIFEYEIVYPENLEIEPLITKYSKRGRKPKKKIVEENTVQETEKIIDEPLEESIPIKKFRTRSGRITKPPKHIEREFHKSESIKTNTTDSITKTKEPESFKSTSEIIVKNEPLKINNEPSIKNESIKRENVDLQVRKRHIPSQFRCPKCKKAYMGYSRLEKHLQQNPDHGSSSECHKSQQDSIAWNHLINLALKCPMGKRGLKFCREFTNLLRNAKILAKVLFKEPPPLEQNLFYVDENLSAALGIECGKYFVDDREIFVAVYSILNNIKVEKGNNAQDDRVNLKKNVREENKTESMQEQMLDENSNNCERSTLQNSNENSIHEIREDIKSFLCFKNDSAVKKSDEIETNNKDKTETKIEYNNENERKHVPKNNLKNMPNNSSNKNDDNPSVKISNTNDVFDFDKFLLNPTSANEEEKVKEKTSNIKEQEEKNAKINNSISEFVVKKRPKVSMVKRKKTKKKKLINDSDSYIGNVFDEKRSNSTLPSLFEICSKNTKEATTKPENVSSNHISDYVTNDNSKEKLPALIDISKSTTSQSQDIFSGGKLIKKFNLVCTEKVKLPPLTKIEKQSSNSKLSENNHKCETPIVRTELENDNNKKKNSLNIENTETIDSNINSVIMNLETKKDCGELKFYCGEQTQNSKILDDSDSYIESVFQEKSRNRIFPSMFDSLSTSDDDKSRENHSYTNLFTTKSSEDDLNSNTENMKESNEKEVALIKDRFVSDSNFKKDVKKTEEKMNLFLLEEKNSLNKKSSSSEKNTTNLNVESFGNISFSNQFFRYDEPKKSDENQFDLNSNTKSFVENVFPSIFDNCLISHENEKKQIWTDRRKEFNQFIPLEKIEKKDLKSKNIANIRNVRKMQKNLPKIKKKKIDVLNNFNAEKTRDPILPSVFGNEKKETLKIVENNEEKLPSFGDYFLNQSSLEKEREDNDRKNPKEKNFSFFDNYSTALECVENPKINVLDGNIINEQDLLTTDIKTKKITHKLPSFSDQFLAKKTKNLENNASGQIEKRTKIKKKKPIINKGPEKISNIFSFIDTDVGKVSQNQSSDPNIFLKKPSYGDFILNPEKPKKKAFKKSNSKITKSCKLKYKNTSKQPTCQETEKQEHIFREPLTYSGSIFNEKREIEKFSSLFDNSVISSDNEKDTEQHVHVNKEEKSKELQEAGSFDSLSSNDSFDQNAFKYPETVFRFREQKTEKTKQQKEDFHDILADNSLLNTLTQSAEELITQHVSSGFLENSVSSSDEILNVDQFVNERFKNITEPDLEINLDLQTIDLFPFGSS